MGCGPSSPAKVRAAVHVKAKAAWRCSDAPMRSSLPCRPSPQAAPPAAPRPSPRHLHVPSAKLPLEEPDELFKIAFAAAHANKALPPGGLPAPGEGRHIKARAGLL